jgi:uncharacterized protein
LGKRGDNRVEQLFVDPPWLVRADGRQVRYNHNMKKAKITIPRARLAEFSGRWNISELALFGSVLREDFRPDSDVDVLVSFSSDARVSLFDMARMQDELKEIFGHNVDLVSKRGLENSRNYLRRKQILDSAQVIHVAR